MVDGEEKDRDQVKKRAVVFDLDGTLIDSEPDILAALNRALAVSGLEGLSREAIRPMIGDGAKTLVERAFAAQGGVGGARELKNFLADYNANAVVLTRPYPGILAALAALRAAGHVLAVCTNKPVGVARDILHALGMSGYFAVVTGGDSTPYRKPDPRHLAATLAALETDFATMIGDHENDMAAARGLGMPHIFVEWGYGTGRGTYHASHAVALPGLIMQMG
ncbi:MAG: HAD-IA family hydrolase [Acidocella sp.]|nr:HAD-IA family hydrolase [Acidocella sp.]